MGLVIVASLIIFSKIGRIQCELKSYDWIQGRATITASKIYIDTDRRGGRGGNGGGGTVSTLHGIFSYEFTHEGKIYHGRKYDMSGKMNSFTWREDFYRNNYAVGSKVPVFFDPENPSDCVLSAGLTGDTQVRFVFASLFTLISFVVFRFMREEKRR